MFRYYFFWPLLASSVSTLLDKCYYYTARHNNTTLLKAIDSMTDRHIFNDHTTLVLRSLKGLVASHPSLALIPSLKVVYRADHDRSKVALICGGGSGHEPGTSGHVGRGLLSASVCGDVFASPSAKQVFGAYERVKSDKGTILIITNCECGGSPSEF